MSSSLLKKLSSWKGALASEDLVWIKMPEKLKSAKVNVANGETERERRKEVEEGMKMGREEERMEKERKRKCRMSSLLILGHVFREKTVLNNIKKRDELSKSHKSQ